MATIDDYGGADAALDNPPLGGPGGWAAAVAAAIRSIPTVRAGVARTGTDGNAQISVANGSTVVGITEAAIGGVAVTSYGPGSATLFAFAPGTGAAMPNVLIRWIAVL